jgi:nitrogen-specific signal transduction histidine kinase
MQCPRCDGSNVADARRCAHCGAVLTVAQLELVRGELPERTIFLAARAYTVGRARHNDLSLADPSISKAHARIEHDGKSFFIEDSGSLHGVYVDAVRVQRAELASGAQVQLGNITLRFSLMGPDGPSTEEGVSFPWVEQQQLLLSLVRALNSTLVLTQVLEQVLDALMRITRAERGFLLLAEPQSGEQGGDPVGGLHVRLARRRGGESIPPADVQGLSSSVVRKALRTGETVATGNAVADPSLGGAQSVILMDLRTIVCIPLRSPRVESGDAEGRTLGAIYVDNPETSAPISSDSLRISEALAHHAALAIENAQLFEREQATIRELRQAQSRLLQSEKLATIGQMAAGIAHELNTPLTYIMGNLELMQAQPLSDLQQTMLRSIGHGADRLKNLAHSLLAFSRPAQEVRVPLGVNDVIERALELCHYQILRGGVALEKRLGEGLPPISGVANQLEIAIINLVVNAVHAMEGGGTLVVTSALVDPDVEIVISDTGHGIPEAIHSSIFEPFFTTKPEGTGTGLGLSTVLMIVERHQGRIELTSAAGRGTTFRIVLPAAG